MGGMGKTGLQNICLSVLYICKMLYLVCFFFLQDMVIQGLELSRKPHVVVATPGRLADHIRSSDTISLNKIQFLVMMLNFFRHFNEIIYIDCYVFKFSVLKQLFCVFWQIMDEADRLLEQGCTDFTKDLEVILSVVPAKRQTLLFSATLTDTLQQLQSVAMNKPFFWEHKSE